MCRYAIPHMKNAGSGSIINVSSVTALRPKPGRSSAQYTVNKSAVVGLTRALALDHADDNIRANCIMPGLMWTPRLASASSDAREMRRTSTPLPVEGQSWDIGNAALFLASDEARFITGITLPVDGGFLLTSAPKSGVQSPLSLWERVRVRAKRSFPCERASAEKQYRSFFRVSVAPVPTA